MSRSGGPVTRFAPSPSGRLHPGNARTALFNWLAARAGGGRMILRFEDTDATRSTEEAAEALMSDLAWLGLDWDEGPDVGGEAAPYRQSQRGDIYARHLEALEQAGHAYPCFCSAEELEAARRAQARRGEAPRYPGTCRGLDPEERERRRAQGREPALRFAIPPGRDLSFEDVVRGEVRFMSDDLGDFVLRRADGSPNFLFTNAVDDAGMGVTLVLRGEDHLANVPRQMLILEALGLPVPDYGHVAMVVDAEGAPLGTRRGATPLSELRERGFLPSALRNHLARLGHTYAETGALEVPALIAGFDLARLGRAPARHDEQQLRHWQKEAVRALDADAFRNWVMRPDLRGAVPEDRLGRFLTTVRENVETPQDARTWAERLFGRPDPSEAARSVIAEAGAGFYGSALEYLPRDGGLREWTDTLKAASGRKGKELFMPLRAALTGEVHGPELAAVFDLLGQDRVRARLERALEMSRRKA